MGNLKLYLAHPAPDRDWIRKQELFIEERYPITLINPFYDTERKDMVDVDSGKRALAAASLDYSAIVENDLSAIDEADGLLAIITSNISIGTHMEMWYAYTNHIPIFTICFEQSRIAHPWVRYVTEPNCIFDSFDKFVGKITSSFIPPTINILFVGKRRVGKDTAGKYLINKYNFRRFAFADEVKYITKRLKGYTSNEIKEKPPVVVNDLQKIGTECFRSIYPDIWIDYSFRIIDRKRKVLPAEYARIVITDGRFENEVHRSNLKNFWIVKITKGKIDQIHPEHVSETESEGILPDYSITNDGTFDELYKQIDDLPLIKDVWYKI